MSRIIMGSRKLAEMLLFLVIVGPLLATCQSRGEQNTRPIAPANTGYGENRQQFIQSQSQPAPEYYQQSPQSQPPYLSYQNQNYNIPPQSDQVQYQAYSPPQSMQVQYQAQYSQSNVPVQSTQSQYQTAYNQPQQSYNNQYQPAAYQPPTYQSPPTNYQNPHVAINPYDSRPPSQPPQSPPNYYNPQSQTYDLQNRNSPEATNAYASPTNKLPFDPDFPPPSRNKTKPATRPRKPPPTTPGTVLGTRFDDRKNEIFTKTLPYDKDLANNIESFSLELMYNLNLLKKDETFMISPFSIYHMLVLIAEGAAGETYNQIDEKLKLISLQRTRDFQQYLNVILKQSTSDTILKKFALMVTDLARPVKPDFENTIEKVYDATVEPVNFADVDNTVNHINRLVSENTNGEIKDAVKREDLFRAQLILITGLFFQGTWANIFNQSFTKREPFYDTNGKEIGQVNMMFQRGPIPYAAVVELGCHILELPYADTSNLNSRNDDTPIGKGLSMIIALPRKGLSLEEALFNIHSRGMVFINKELYNAAIDYADEEVEVHLPRFQIETTMDLRAPLESMGITDMFDTRANLSNINQQYYISAMVHKTKISVDEKGTVAAAVTTATFANKATPPKFHANKPFLYFIIDKPTRLILFSGQYASPTLY